MDELIFPSSPSFSILLLSPFNKPTLQPSVFGHAHRIKLTSSLVVCLGAFRRILGCFALVLAEVFKCFYSFDGSLKGAEVQHIKEQLQQLHPALTVHRYMHKAVPPGQFLLC